MSNQEESRNILEKLATDCFNKINTVDNSKSILVTVHPGEPLRYVTVWIVPEDYISIQAEFTEADSLEINHSTKNKMSNSWVSNHVSKKDNGVWSQNDDKKLEESLDIISDIILKATELSIHETDKPYNIIPDASSIKYDFDK